MNIAIISRSDTSGGGAGRIASKLTALLNQQEGINAHQWVGYPGNRKQSTIYDLHWGVGGQFLYRAALFFSRKIGLPDFYTPEIFFHKLIKKIDYDLYHLHDISVTLSPIAVNRISKRKLVVWTFHDCSPFTGGCLYPMECKAYIAGCHDCPQMNEWPMITRFDRTGYIQRYKTRVVNRTGIVPIAPSNWIKEKASESYKFEQSPVIIPNAVDQKIFYPFGKNLVRELLKIPKECFVILISSMDLNNKRKGTGFAFQAIREMKRDLMVLAIGDVSDPAHIKKELPEQKIILPGLINDDRLLAQYYAAADVYLFPTLADNLPNVILETMACGTPTIGFKTGGVPEIIDHNESGWLSEKGDVKGLINGLKIAMDQPERLKTWISNGLLRIKKKFNHDRFLKDHLELYKSISRQRPN